MSSSNSSGTVISDDGLIKRLDSSQTWSLSGDFYRGRNVIFYLFPKSLQYLQNVYLNLNLIKNYTKGSYIFHSTNISYNYNIESVIKDIIKYNDQIYGTKSSMYAYFEDLFGNERHPMWIIGLLFSLKKFPYKLDFGIFQKENKLSQEEFNIFIEGFNFAKKVRAAAKQIRKERGTNKRYDMLYYPIRDLLNRGESLEDIKSHINQISVEQILDQ